MHVWVFALHTATAPTAYDPLDLDHWEFRVIPHRELFDAGQMSARLSFFDAREIRAVSYNELQRAVEDARARNDEL